MKIYKCNKTACKGRHKYQAQKYAAEHVKVRRAPAGYSTVKKCQPMKNLYSPMDSEKEHMRRCGE